LTLATLAALAGCSDSGDDSGGGSVAGGDVPAPPAVASPAGGGSSTGGDPGGTTATGGDATTTTVPGDGTAVPGDDTAGAAGAGGTPADPPPGAGDGAPAGGEDTVADDTLVEQPPASPSSGCGAADWPAGGDQTIDVDGLQREFIVALPDGYDPSAPHKLVFAWHGLGGSASQIATGFLGGGYYGLQARSSGDTIFVAGQGLDTSNAVGSGPGWDNMGGRDVAFTRAMLEWMRSSYCIDDARIFSVGMSYGGIMSNRVGCELGDDFRAIAPMAGSGPGYGGFGASCVGQVAAWLAHGNTDMVVSFSSGQSSRDHWATENHCGTTTVPTTPDPCVAYEGCDDGYPVHWCEFDGGHTVPSFASEAIWAFFSQF
jgi:poly(3-hydroxybutyrate) depolymerase